MRAATLSITSLAAAAAGVSTVGDRPAEAQQALQYKVLGPHVASAIRPRARQIAQHSVGSAVMQFLLPFGHARGAPGSRVAPAAGAAWRSMCASTGESFEILRRLVAKSVDHHARYRH
jgi:hypothetical protein